MEDPIPSTPSLDGDQAASGNEDTLSVIIRHHGKSLEFTLPASATIEDLAAQISTTLNIPVSNQKLLVSPKPGILKPPFPPSSLVDLLSVPKPPKITLLASTASEIAAAQSALKAPERAPLLKSVVPAKTSSLQHVGISAHDAATYTFASIRPLPYLPEPQYAEQYLRRLADDPGIRRCMVKHKFRVGLLTEMDPAAHTDASHEGVHRTLGLNRNRGEVIELRLRTDAGDGWRHYNTVRKTLCHELTHNVWGDHDANFWKLCGELEKEVERGDWWGGRGRTVGEPRGRPRANREEHVDGGAWVGGEYIVGAKGPGGEAGGQTRGEVLAKATEDREKKLQEAEEEEKGDGHGEGQTSSPAS